MSLMNHYSSLSQQAPEGLDKIGLSDETINRRFPRTPKTEREFFLYWIADREDDRTPGTVAMIATTYLTLHTQERAGRLAQGMARKEKLYGEFIEEASRLYSDAMTHKLDEVAKFVHLYALVSKLRLFASAEVMSAADEVMHRILINRETPEEDLGIAISQGRERDLDLLRAFSEACRKEMEL